MFPLQHMRENCLSFVMENFFSFFSVLKGFGRKNRVWELKNWTLREFDNHDSWSMNMENDYATFMEQP